MEQSEMAADFFRSQSVEAKLTKLTIAMKFSQRTNVFCTLYGSCPRKGQENTAHTSRVERFVCVQITKM